MGIILSLATMLEFNVEHHIATLYNRTPCSDTVQQTCGTHSDTVQQQTTCNQTCGTPLGTLQQQTTCNQCGTPYNSKLHAINVAYHLVTLQATLTYKKLFSVGDSKECGTPLLWDESNKWWSTVYVVTYVTYGIQWNLCMVYDYQAYTCSPREQHHHGEGLVDHWKVR